MAKLMVIPQMIQMSQVTHTLLLDIATRGQQIKVFNLIYRFACERGYVMNIRDSGWDKNAEYQGATVIEPERGYYTHPVATLDFASLYPSIIIGNTLCPSTLVLDEEFKHLANVQYARYMLGGKEWTFVTHLDGIVPAILKSLLAARRATKKQMKSVQDPFLLQLLDAKQLAQKLSSNSTYGFFGVDPETAMYGCMPVANATTYIGRTYIERTRQFVEKEFPGCHVLYGDSVAGTTPLLLRVRSTGRIQVMRIDELVRYDGVWVVDYHGYKETMEIHDYDSWTETGWTPIQRVIRHLLPAKTKLVRVTTHIGSVDVTTDHSLLLKDGRPVKPSDISVGSELLHSFPNLSHRDPEVQGMLPVTNVSPVPAVIGHIDYRVLLDGHNNEHDSLSAAAKAWGTTISTIYQRAKKESRGWRWDARRVPIYLSLELAQVMGMFMGDGSCGTYNTPSSGIKRTWAINGNDMSLLETYKRLAESAFPLSELTWCIDNTITSSGAYKLTPRCARSSGGAVAQLVDLFRGHLYGQTDKFKRVPAIILNASADIRRAFWHGLWDADGSKTTGNTMDNCSIDQKGAVTCLGIYTLLRSLGYEYVSINALTSKNEEYYRIRISTRFAKEPTAVKMITSLAEMDTPCYVYDLTTSTNHFHAGVGQLIVHNTDSVMLNLKGLLTDVPRSEWIRTSFRIATEMAQRASAIFPQAVNIEFEKVFLPYLLDKKKRYAGLKYADDPDKPPKYDAKGLVTQRRDNCALVRTAVKSVLLAVMRDADPQAAYKCVEDTLQRLLRDEVSLSELEISKSLRRDYANDHQPHLTVVRKLTERKEFNVPSCGDRVPFVIVEGSAGSKMYERAEHPLQVTKLHLKVDRLYYLDNQLRKPLLGILHFLPVPSPQELFDRTAAQLDRMRLGVRSLRDIGLSSGSIASSAHPTTTTSTTLTPTTMMQLQVGQPQPSKKRKSSEKKTTTATMTQSSLKRFCSSS